MKSFVAAAPSDQKKIMPLFSGELLEEEADEELCGCRTRAGRLTVVAVN